MAMYELEKVVLGEVEGEGYAFTRKTVFGKTYQGVFYAEDDEALEALLEGEEELTFEGPVYHRRRDRSSRKKREELTVEIIGSTPTPRGTRTEFSAFEEA